MKRANDDPITSEELSTWIEYPDVVRPKTRADCIDIPRPCPFVSCRYNNFLNITDGGTIVFAFKDRNPEDVPPGDSCALDVAERGHDFEEPLDFVDIGRIIGRTKQQVWNTVDSAQRNARRIRKEMNNDVGGTEGTDKKLERESNRESEDMD